MVNCNPETVSTDYDTSDRLYFEPLTLEDVLEVVARRARGRPGRRRHRAARRPDPARAGAGARGRRRADRRHPPGGDPPRRGPRRVRPGARRGRPARARGTASATSFDEAQAIADEIGYPVLVRPSYVLGGRGMEIVYDDDDAARRTSSGATEVSPEHPVLVDRFLDDAVEIDVDALFDGDELYLGGVMEHIEEAGIHSGDSACALPPITLGARRDRADPRRAPRRSPRGVGVRGLLNVQYALAGDVLYVLEANPRASRTVPFVSKATAVPLAKAAARVMLGATHRRSCAAEGLLPRDGRRRRPAARRADRGQGGGAAVQPLPHVHGRRRHRARPGDAVDRRGHGHRRRLRHGVRQVPGRPRTAPLPTEGRVFVSVANRDKRPMIFPVKRLADLGFEILATEGTAEVLRRNGVAATVVRKHSEGPGRRRADDRRSGSSTARSTWSSTPRSASGGPRLDGYEIRTAAVAARRPVHHHRAGARGGGAGHRGAARRRDRRAVAAGAARRGLRERGRRRATRGTTRSDAERASADRAGRCRCAARCCLARRVGDYHALTLVGAGHRRADPPGQLRRARRRRRRRRSMLLRRAFSIYRVAARGRLRRHRRDRVRRARQGHRAGWPSAAARPGRRRRSARQAVRAAARAGRLRPRRRRLRLRAAVRARRAAARARLPRRLRARRRDRGPAVRRAGRQAHRGHASTVTTDDGVGRRARAGHRRAARR